MNVTKAETERTRQQTIELALEAMRWVMVNKSIPHAARYRVAQAHTALLGCSSTATVVGVEEQRGRR